MRNLRGAADIAEERERQMANKGRSLERDQRLHCDGELAIAAGCYAHNGVPDARVPRFWPWDDEWWKPTSRRRALVKAGALIAAEIDRLDSLDTKEGETDEERN